MSNQPSNGQSIPEVLQYLRTCADLADAAPAADHGLAYVLPSSLRAVADEIEQLRQFKEWAEPQIHDHGADVLEIERLRADIAHRNALDRLGAPISCEIHGLMPDMALFDHKCPACERDRARGVPETGAPQK